MSLLHRDDDVRNDRKKKTYLGNNVARMFENLASMTQPQSDLFKKQHEAKINLIKITLPSAGSRVIIAYLLAHSAVA